MGEHPPTDACIDLGHHGRERCVFCGLPSDDELPGMWESSDLWGGESDTNDGGHSGRHSAEGG